MTKIFRISTVPISLNILLKGQLKYLSHFFEITAVSGGGRDLDEVAARETVRTMPLEMKRKISPVKDLISLVQMYFLLKKEKPQIVHSITPKAGLISMLAAKFAGVPIRMHTFTGLIFPSRQGIMQKLLIVMDRLVCWAATSIYPEGEGVKTDLIKFNITKKPLKIIGNGNVNGIDIEYYNPKQISSEQRSHLKHSLGICDTDFVFVFVGRLVADKGINELVEAFSQSGIKNSKLLLVGTYEQELDPLSPSTIKNIQSNPHIITVGFQKDIRPYLAISNLFVFPSYREGFPNVVMQAGAMDLPCLVTDISGSNEIIKDSVNGLIVPVKNTHALSEKMTDLRENPKLMQQLRSNSRGLIESRYEQKKLWNLIHKEYKVLLEEAKLE